MTDTPYRHTQRGRATLLACGLGCVAMLAVLLVAPQPIPAGAIAAVAFATSVMLFCAWAFSALTVEVTERELSWYFGPNVLRRRIPLAEIASATPIRTTLWQGIGIHWMGAWLYNVAAGDAVEVVTVAGKRVRIGTDEPVALANTIERAARDAARGHRQV